MSFNIRDSISRLKKKPVETSTSPLDAPSLLFPPNETQKETSKPKDERTQAADSLRDWIDKRKPANAKILEQLEQDLRSNKNLNEWGQFALEDLLRPPRREAEGLFTHRIAAIVTFIRNIVLFIPVGVTWLAIENAAEKYRENLQPVDSSPPTFLEVWIEDVTFLTLATTALIDALLIGALILLTVAAQAFESVADRQANQMDLQDETEFQTVLVRVGLFLHGFRAITPSALKSGLAEAVDKLGKASEQLALVADRATDTLTQFAQVSTAQLEPAARRIDGIVSALGSAAGAHEQMTQLVRGLQDNLGQSLGLLTHRIDDFGSTLQQKMADNNRLLEAAMRGLLQEVDEVTSHLKTTAVEAREVAYLYRERNNL